MRNAAIQAARAQQTIRVLKSLKRAADEREQRLKAQAERRLATWKRAQRATVTANSFALAGQEHSLRRNWLMSPLSDRRDAVPLNDPNHLTEERNETKSRISAHVDADEIDQAARLSRRLVKLEDELSALRLGPSGRHRQPRPPRHSRIPISALALSPRVRPSCYVAPSERARTAPQLGSSGPRPN
eukprot:7036743-Prymnesium_polylepis.1